MHPRAWLQLSRTKAAAPDKVGPGEAVVCMLRAARPAEAVRCTGLADRVGAARMGQAGPRRAVS